MHVNNLFQLWRAMLTLINQCLTDKTSRSDKPRHPVLQMLWGIVTRSNVDYAKLLPESPVHVTGDDFPLGNLKFVPKGEKDEVFGKPILKELITEAIQTSPYFQQYLDMVARKPTAKRDEQKKTASADDKPKNPTPIKKPTLAKQTKPMKEKSTKPSPLKQAGKGKVRKVRKGKSSLQLFDEEEQVHLEPEPQVEDEEYDLQRAETIRQLPVVFQKRTPATEDASTLPFAQHEDETSANIVCDTLSPIDAEIGGDTDKTNSKDPGKTLESRPLPERVLMEEDKSGLALIGPNPKPMHDDFVAIAYPNIHESLKHTTEEHVHLENPLSSSSTLSSMKNLEDNFTFGVPIHQVSSSVPPLSTHVIYLTPPKPIFANFEKKNKYINENVKEVVQDALQAPVRKRFRELSKFKMKEILHDRMFESGSNQSLPEHTALYEALEASMECENRKEFMDTTTKSRKRRCDDQDPTLLPLKGSGQSKKTRHDSDASGSK
ncbi:hypothetical protein Tco_1221245 [Tanacetum coccineum]